MNKFQLIISAGLLALSVTTLSAVTPQQSDSLHTKVWSVYAQGGISIAEGLEIENIDAPKGTKIAPLYGVGVSYQFKPWIRLSLNYEYSKYTREQRYSRFQSFSQPMLSFPNMELRDDSYGGQIYYKTWTGFHNIDLTADFNILELWKNRQNKWFNLYLSTGIGYAIANGNSYDISMGYEHWAYPQQTQREAVAQVRSSDNPFQNYNNSHELYSWVTVDNSRHYFNSFYLPVSLAAEFDVSPRITLGAKGMYKYMFNNDDFFAPKHLFGAVAVVRFNFVGAKHGYRSNKNRLADLRDDYNKLLNDYQRAQKECADNAAAQADRIKRLENDNDLLRKNLAECEARPTVVEECSTELSVQFLLNSAVISELENTRLLAFIETLKADESITFQLVGEASVDGKADYNQKLSEARLDKVISVLKENGISENRISRSSAIGASAGIDDAIARRVTIVVD